MNVLPENDSDRGDILLASGLIDYFPNACAAVARHSAKSNAKHNPKQPMHWARDKSTDHRNKIMRHLVDAGGFDADGNRHSVAIAWRGLALLEDELIAEGATPGRNAKGSPVNHARKLYDETSAIHAAQDAKSSLAELAQEAQRWGMYAHADTPEKSPLAPTRIATTDELRRLEWLKANARTLDRSAALKNAGIGDVPCNPRAAHDAKIAFDVAWDRRPDGTPAEPAYLASFAPNPHPMMAESLRDEYEKTNEGTGL